jgi:Xaa-Pro aminopeptidase
MQGILPGQFRLDPGFSDSQKEIYQIVLNAYQAAVAALKPGIRFKDVHLLACRKLAEGLKDLGIMKGNLDEAWIREPMLCFSSVAWVT